MKVKLLKQNLLGFVVKRPNDIEVMYVSIQV